MREELCSNPSQSPGRRGGYPSGRKHAIELRVRLVQELLLRLRILLSPEAMVHPAAVVTVEHDIGLIGRAWLTRTREHIVQPLDRHEDTLAAVVPCQEDTNSQIVGIRRLIRVHHGGHIGVGQRCIRQHLLPIFERAIVQVRQIRCGLFPDRQHSVPDVSTGRTGQDDCEQCGSCECSSHVPSVRIGKAD